MSRPNLSHLWYNPGASDSASTESTASIDMKRQLPSLFTQKEEPSTRRRGDDEPDGWEMPADWSEPKKSDFRAAMANLDTFTDSLQYEVEVLDDSKTIDPFHATMDWGSATDVQKRAFGKALRLFHNENPDVVMYRVNGVLEYPSVEYEALLYAPYQWWELFNQRQPWSVEIEEDEDSSGPSFLTVLLSKDV